MSKKPVIGSRNILSKSSNSTSSTAIVQQRLPKDESTSPLVTSGRVGLVVLLGLASIGMVFTLKHPPEQLPAKTPETDSARNVSVVAVNHPVSRAHFPVSASGKRVRTTVQPESSPVPAVNRKQFEIKLDPAVIAAVLGVVERATSGGFLVALGKTRSDPTVEPKEFEKPATAIVEDLRPRDNPAAKLAPTELPGAENRDQTFGTKIKFMTDLPAAWAEAKEKKKLVLLIAYAGEFQHGAFVSEKAEQFRKDCLMADDVADFLQKKGFVCVFQRVSELPKEGPMKTGGSVVTYLCENDKGVLHAIGGPVNAIEFLKELEWILGVRKKAIADVKANARPYGSDFRKAHTQKYLEDGPDPQKQINGLLASMTFDRLPNVEKVAPKIYVGIMGERPMK